MKLLVKYININGKAVLACDLLALAKLKTPAELVLILQLVVHNVLEFQWAMEDLTQHFLQQKMNIKDQCQVE